MGLFCAVSGCHNGAVRLKQWKQAYCFICECFRVPSSSNQAGPSKTCSCQPPFRLFPFPTAKQDREGRDKWKQLVNRQKKNGHVWSPGKDSRVCSHHFINERPTTSNPYPTVNLGYVDAQSRVRRMLFGEHTKATPAKRRKVKPDWTEEKLVKDPPVEVLQKELPEFVFLPWRCMAVVLAVMIFIIQIASSYYRKAAYLYGHVNKLSKLLLEEKAKSSKLSAELAALKSSSSKKSVSLTLLKSDSDVCFYTGIQNKKLFYEILNLVCPYVKRRWRGSASVSKLIHRFKAKTWKRGPNRYLHSSDELLLTMMKIRLGLLNTDLAARFNISTCLVSQIFFSWLRALSCILSSIIYLPDMDEIIASKPARFQQLNAPDLYCIIDCTEIFIQTPKDPFLQCITWSEYKHHNTLKFLVAIAPNGTIIFISKAYTGRISDKKLTIESGFLDMLPPYSMIMADKGFNIEDECADRSLSLHIPPGKRGQSQMTSAAVRKTKRIANTRILVEQVIREIKIFRLLQTEMPLSLVSHIDDIITVCAALVNFKQSIYK